ncbi:hypothetical protein PO124_34565 [Bacillus licheniformis]|nr:hypothetical protein [Bacillus licheniformis]
MSNHQKKLSNIPQRVLDIPADSSPYSSLNLGALSYYGMRAILIYYLYTEVTKGGLGFDQTTANSIMAVYGSLVYMSGIIGAG